MIKNRIKIFVDCHVFDNGFQGTRTYLDGLYSTLIKDETKHFYLAASNVENLKANFGEQSNITYIKYNSNSAILRLLFEIPMLIFKYKIDFAHFQYRVPPIKLCKYIVTTHDVLFEDFPQDFPKLNRIQSFLTYKFSAKIAEIVFTVSDYSKNQIEKHLKVKNVIVMPNGVSDVFFEEYDKKEIQSQVLKEYGFSNYLIYISRWEPRKNHHLLLKSFVSLKLYETHSLVFIGDTTFKYKEFDDFYNQLPSNITDKIFIFKKIEFEKMLFLLRGAIASVYPSRAEGFGIPPLESIATKTPAICSNQTAMSDFKFLKQYLFNPFLEKEFEKAISNVLEHGDSEIQEKQKIIKQNYNWNVAATIFNETIEKYK